MSIELSDLARNVAETPGQYLPTRELTNGELLAGAISYVLAVPDEEFRNNPDYLFVYRGTTGDDLVAIAQLVTVVPARILAKCGREFEAVLEAHGRKQINQAQQTISDLTKPKEVSSDS